MITKQRLLWPSLALSLGMGAGLAPDVQATVAGRECYIACDTAYEQCMQAGNHWRLCLTQHAQCYSGCDDFPEN
jgi:hypothetical protein